MQQTRPITPEVISRLGDFWSKVNVAGQQDCWEWKLSLNAQGYGKTAVYVNGRRLHFRSHRLAYVLANGQDVPEGLLVLHSCDNRKCCNPEHLSCGSTRQNSIEMYQRGRGHRVIPSGSDSTSAKAVDCAGLLFGSVTEAARHFGIAQSTATKRTQKGTFGWKFA